MRLEIARPPAPLLPQPSRPLTGRGHVRVADAGSRWPSERYCLVSRLFPAHAGDLGRGNRLRRHLSPEAAAVDVAALQAYERGQELYSLRWYATGHTEVASIAINDGLFLSTGSDGGTAVVLVEARAGHYTRSEIFAASTARPRLVGYLPTGEIAVAAEYTIGEPCEPLRILFQPAAEDPCRRRAALWQSGSIIYIVAGPGELTVEAA